jgi:hypothetical protein
MIITISKQKLFGIKNEERSHLTRMTKYLNLVLHHNFHASVIQFTQYKSASYTKPSLHLASQAFTTTDENDARVQSLARPLMNPRLQAHFADNFSP